MVGVEARATMETAQMMYRSCPSHFKPFDVCIVPFPSVILGRHHIFNVLLFMLFSHPCFSFYGVYERTTTEEIVCLPWRVVK